MLIGHINEIEKFDSKNILMDFGIDDNSLRIKKLILENFKKFEDRISFSFYKNKKHDINLVIGGNATGKTTVFEGIYHCLTGNRDNHEDYLGSYVGLVLEDDNNLIEIIRNHGNVSVKINDKNTEKVDLILSAILNKIIFSGDGDILDLIQDYSDNIEKLVNAKCSYDSEFISQVNKSLNNCLTKWHRPIEIKNDGCFYKNGERIISLNRLACGDKLLIGILILLIKGSLYNKILIIDSPSMIFDEEYLNLYESLIREYNHQMILLEKDNHLHLNQWEKDTEILYL